MTRPEKVNTLDMLQGNINRMCVTDSRDELRSMYAWANIRLNEIYRMNDERLRDAARLEILQRELKMQEGNIDGKICN